MKRYLLYAAVICLQHAFASSAPADVAHPAAWWTFDNEQGQTLATSDGIIPDKGPLAIDLVVRSYNGRGGAPQLFFQRPHSLYPPPEHYVPSGASFPGANSAYHMEGGTSRIYDDGTGNPESDPDMDPRTTPVLEVNKDIYSYRDGLGIHPSVNVGDLFDSSGGSNGGTLTYAFWLNVQAASRLVDGERFGSDTSFLIGRGSDDVNGFSGEVSIRKVGGNVFEPQYALQVRNDRLFDGSFAPADTRIQNSSGLGITAGKDEWHHYVVQYDLTGATGSVAIWQDGGTANGGLQGTLTGFGTRPITGLFRINQVAHPGAAPKESGDFIIDDLAVWSGVLLDDQDVTELFTQGLAASFDLVVVPELASVLLLILGVAVLGWYRGKRRFSR